MIKTVLSKCAGALAVSVLVSAIGYAQGGMVQIEGTVKMKSDDGKGKPVQGAIIDIYRRDIKGSWKDLKTDKNGHYIRLGMTVQGVFMVVISGPGIKPSYVDNVRPGQNPVVDFEAEPGDGQRLTYEEIVKQVGQMKTQTAQPGAAAPPVMSKEEKAKLEAQQKAQKEEYAKNEELQQGFDAALKHFNTGVELKKNKKPEEALSEFEQASKVDPNKHGALAEVAHRSHAHMAEINSQLGVDLYNQKQKDAAKTHFEAAVASIKRAIEVAGIAKEKEKDKEKAVNADLIVYYDIEAKNVKFLVELFGESKLIDDELKDLDKAEALDGANKKKLEVFKGDLYRSAGNTDSAVAAYKVVLAADPSNLDALFGAGLSLLASEDKAKLQESANYLADFVSKAPASDRRVADAKSTLDALKNDQKVEAEKPAKRGKAKP
jgi:tetratricopeptide (TPR) repeat protein